MQVHGTLRFGVQSPLPFAPSPSPDVTVQLTTTANANKLEYAVNPLSAVLFVLDKG